MALAVAIVSAVAVVVAGGTGARAASGPTHHDGGGERGPLDVLSAKQSQSRDRIKIEVKTRDRWAPQSLQGNPTIGRDTVGSYLCLELRQSSKVKRYCLTRRRNGKTAMLGGTLRQSGDVSEPHSLPSAIIRRKGRNGFSTSFRYGAPGLHPGGFRWRVLSAWARGECAPEEPPPVDPPPGPEPEAESQQQRDVERDRRARREPCRDVAPNKSLYRASVIRPRIVGCTRDEDLFNFSGPRGKKRIALTFDDGPSSYSDRIIDILRRTHTEATFFWIGENIPGRTSLLRRAFQEDNELGNHSLHHETGGASYGSIRETSKRIRQATGFEPCLYRPPGGNLSSSSARAAWSQGMSNILWDVDTNDWQGPSASTIYSRVVNGARSGSIVLMHDGGGNRSATVAALDDIIHTLKRRGYQLVTVTKLLGERYRWIP